MSTLVAAIVGVGPGLGAALVRRFGQEGYAVAWMARDPKNSPLGGGFDSMRTLAVETDATDAGSVHRAFAEVERELGSPEVLIYNAGAFQRGGILEVTPEEFERAWKANCQGGFLAAREVVPKMLERGTGTILFTGATASLRGSAGFSCLAVGKFGLRALAQSLARELGPRGIHVAHVVIDGQIDTPRLRRMMPDRAKETMLAPEAIAETYWHLHRQHPTAWTQELDLRPAVEKF